MRTTLLHVVSNLPACSSFELSIEKLSLDLFKVFDIDGEALALGDLYDDLFVRCCFELFFGYG